MGLDFSLDDLEYKLENFSKNVVNKYIDEALDVGVDICVKELKKNVPVDTEELRNSLGEISRLGTGIKRRSMIGSTSKDRKVVERAYYQEYGNSSMIGRKWMKKSFYNSKDEILEKMVENLRDNILG